MVPLKIEWNFTNVKSVETRATSAVEKKDEVNDAKNGRHNVAQKFNLI